MTNIKTRHASQPEAIDVKRGAWKFERWLDKQKSVE